ncbi:uncharacterized protein LOC129618500 [Condylostylus longicornis]|uniref:uncharacterized protein LOC129618500 n=1 Tax=Condylostylus longicornis TaxID=2530218 RepID=UPI00244DBF1F|nr:uncharacterized protein LOC129618500 [Condylostylus longicornis]
MKNNESDVKKNNTVIFKVDDSCCSKKVQNNFYENGYFHQDVSFDETINNIGSDPIRKPRKRLITNESADISTTSSKKPEIPDGGYGWIVVFASFCISLVADGVSFSFGLLYTELLAYFKESKAKTAWVGSLFLSVPLLLGPVMSNLVDKYGCRKMTIIGGLLSSVGFALGSICSSIEMLYITFGVISGIGLGIGYVTAVVSITFWFDKKRTFATGIGASGTGIGTFIYAPFTAWLIEYYGWRGATLILAGTMLNSVVFGALMRDPDWLNEEDVLDSRCQSEITLLNCDTNFLEVKKLIDDGATNDDILDSLVSTCNAKQNESIEDITNQKIFKIKRYHSEEFLPKNNLDNFYPLTTTKSKQEKCLKAPSIAFSLSTIASRSTICERCDESNRTSKYLASAESLSPSENISLNSFNPFSTEEKRSVDPFTLKYVHNKDINENNVDGRYKNKRRLSLNENLISHNSLPNLQIDLRRNTLGILKINNNDKKNLENLYILKETSTNKTENISTKIDTILDNCENVIELKKINNRHSSYKKRSSIKNQQCIQPSRFHRNSIIARGIGNNILNIYKNKTTYHKSSSCPNILNNNGNSTNSIILLPSKKNIEEDVEENLTWRSNLIKFLKSVCDFSLYLDLKFSLFNFSTLFLFIWYIIPYFCITEYMIEYNYTEEDSAFLISIIGIFNTIGMITLGFIGDRPWLNVNIMYSICMLLCGLSVILMPLAINCYYSLIGLSIIFGLTFASTFSFTPSILVSLVDLDDFTSAYGLILLTEGIGSLLGPPLAALIYDYTLKWDDSFYVAGAFISFSGVLSYIVELLERHDRAISEKNGILILNNDIIKKTNEIIFV